jgi:hypothetical protein
MVTQQQSAPIRRVAHMSLSVDERSVTSDRVGRLVQIALAVWLIPALLAVLMVGSLGMLVLSIGRCAPFRSVPR